MGRISAQMDMGCHPASRKGSRAGMPQTKRAGPRSPASGSVGSHAMLRRNKTKYKATFFGHFGAANFGNEATLIAMLRNIRRLIPSAELECITTWPMGVTRDYGLAAIPVSDVVVKQWSFSNPLAKLCRKAFVGVPSEIYRWLKATRSLRDTEFFIVVGTGLLTDAFRLGGWGPYSVFKWTVAAKLAKCKVCFVSVGAGPLERPIGRFLIKFSLSLADFCSFRDQATLEYMRSIGLRREADRVFPDLAFSLPSDVLPQARPPRNGHPIVGLGLMTFDGMYGVEKTTRGHYNAYLETLVDLVKWLLGHGYDIRLLIGDLSDEPTITAFKSLLKKQPIAAERVIAEPVTSTDNLLSQIAATDFVVATRFHNVLLSLLLNKPTISMSFHHKCSSLMSQMGLSDYCQDIQKLNGEKLVEQFCQLEKNAAILKQTIAAKAAEFRTALD